MVATKRAANSCTNENLFQTTKLWYALARTDHTNCLRASYSEEVLPDNTRIGGCNSHNETLSHTYTYTLPIDAPEWH